MIITAALALCAPLAIAPVAHADVLPARGYMAALTLGGTPMQQALPKMDVLPVTSGATVTCNGKRTRLGDAWVTFAGDKVTVRDHCDDRRAVKGIVGYIYNGKKVTHTCTTWAGANSWRTCNFDWPEGPLTKTIMFYHQSEPNSLKWTLGTIRHWRDG